MKTFITLAMLIGSNVYAAPFMCEAALSGRKLTATLDVAEKWLHVGDVVETVSGTAVVHTWPGQNRTRYILPTENGSVYLETKELSELPAILNFGGQDWPCTTAK